jgi:glucuronokinase
MIETFAYARAGLLGNPSDGYFGKTIALIVRNFRARAVLYPSAKLELRPGKADAPVFESLEELHRTVRWRGYYGGYRLLLALLVRFREYARSAGISLPNRNFTLEYETTIPMRLGMGGSSAILTAALRSLMAYYDVDMPLWTQARLVWEAETLELGVAAGLQDRVVQAYEGVVYMDFGRRWMESRGYGVYEGLEPDLLGEVYVAYQRDLSEGTEVFHSGLRERWLNGEPAVLVAIDQWASFAEQGREALLAGDRGKLHSLVNANFDLRADLCQLGPGNLEMVRAARRAGASANLAGSGGAIVGFFDGSGMFDDLRVELESVGAEVIRPELEKGHESGGPAAHRKGIRDRLEAL